jgi:hypothetical protein
MAVYCYSYVIVNTEFVFVHYVTKHYHHTLHSHFLILFSD